MTWVKSRWTVRPLILIQRSRWQAPSRGRATVSYYVVATKSVTPSVATRSRLTVLDFSISVR